MLKRVACWAYYFLAFSIIGWIFETAIMIILHGRFELRGVLFGTNVSGVMLYWGFPAVALYGFGGVILYFFYKRKWKIFKHPVFLFFVSMVALTLLELFASYLTEWLYGRSYWQYNDESFNFQGRIALVPSLTWGALATLSLIYLIPFLDKNFRNRINKSWKYWLMIVLAVYILVCLLLRESLFPLMYSEPSRYS